MKRTDLQSLLSKHFERIQEEIRASEKRQNKAWRKDVKEQMIKALGEITKGVWLKFITTVFLSGLTTILKSLLPF